MQRLRTGDVVQIRNFGPNYITLGRGFDKDGNPRVLLTKNGNIKLDGTARIIKRRISRTNRRKQQVDAHIINVHPSSIVRIHGRRPVNVMNIKESLAPRSGLAHFLVPMTARNGLVTNAPNIHELSETLTFLRDH